MHDLKMIADKSLAALKNNGADKAQCSVRFTETHEFNVDGGKFSLFRTLFEVYFEDNKPHYLQEKLKAGNGISISEDGTISVSFETAEGNLF